METCYWGHAISTKPKKKKKKKKRNKEKYVESVIKY